MTYQMITQYKAANYTPGRPYGIHYITIHYWGDPASYPTFEGVLQTFTSGARSTSAHYVVEDGRVACLVSPDDRAWACGDGIGVGSGGNDQSISIECNPRQSDGDYATIAELIACIRATYGDLPLVPHNRWTATSCPGTYDLDRLDRLARGQSIEEDDMKNVHIHGQEYDPAYAIEYMINILDQIQSAKHISDQVWYGPGDGHIEQAPLYTLRAIQSALEKIAAKTDTDISDVSQEVAAGVRQAIDSIDVTTRFTGTSDK